VDRLFTSRLVPPAILLILVCGGFARGAAGDTSDVTLRTSVAEVRLTFSATDQNHHGIATLLPGDLAVVDKDIVVRNFRSFHRAEFTRLDVALLVDTSSSITPKYRQEITQVAQLLSQSGGVPDDALSIVSFHGEKPALVCAGDCRASHAADQLPAMPAGGLTPLFDSVVYASGFLQQHADPHARKILILLSDGEDTISMHSAVDALNAVIASEVQIYTVSLGAPRQPSPGDTLLHRLADATGGQALTLQQGAAAVLDAILEDFNATYTVTYKLPTHAAGFHGVRVLPTHDLKLKFRCRSGYYYPGDAR